MRRARPKLSNDNHIHLGVLNVVQRIRIRSLSGIELGGSPSSGRHVTVMMVMAVMALLVLIVTLAVLALALMVPPTLLLVAVGATLDETWWRIHGKGM